MCSTWPRNEAQVVLRLVSSPTCLIIGCTVELYRVYTDLLWMNATWMATTGLIPRPQLASFPGHNWPHSQATTGLIPRPQLASSPVQLGGVVVVKMHPAVTLHVYSGRCGSSSVHACSQLIVSQAKLLFSTLEDHYLRQWLYIAVCNTCTEMKL